MADPSDLNGMNEARFYFGLSYDINEFHYSNIARDFTFEEGNQHTLNSYLEPLFPSGEFNKVLANLLTDGKVCPDANPQRLENFTSKEFVKSYVAMLKDFCQDIVKQAQHE